MKRPMLTRRFASLLGQAAAAGMMITLGTITPPQVSAQESSISMEHLGTYNNGGSEISAFHRGSCRLFTTNAEGNSVGVINACDPGDMSGAFTIDLSSYGGGPNSIAIYKDVVAVAVQANVKTDNGSVLFFDIDGNFLNSVTVGALPDMLTFSPNGQYLLVANEGEPNDAYTVDPEGTVSIIDFSKKVSKISQSDVRSVNFRSFNNTTLASSIRIFGPNASVAQDLEPEYITITNDSKTAFVTLQENNAIAEIDIRKGTVTALRGLGFKDHNVSGNGIDASDRDNMINIANWPVYGIFMPDAIGSYITDDVTYLVTANEGDARDYAGFAEEARVKDITLDATAFPNRTNLRKDAQIGRLTITKTMGDIDNDGDYDKLYAFGARSFSIWSTGGTLIYDSGDDLEQMTAAMFADDFNSTNDANNSFDNRSDNKGPEPEGLAIGKIHGQHYLFLGLERIGGIVVFNITDPTSPSFIEYVNNRDFDGDVSNGTAGDLGPEGVLFVDRSDSPTGSPLLIVSNEISGTVSVYEINENNGSAKQGVAGSSLLGSGLQTIAPNPVSSITSITYTLQAPGTVRVDVVNVNGEVVQTITNEAVNAGTVELQADMSGLASGTYYCRLLVDGQIISVRPMQVVR